MPGTTSSRVPATRPGRPRFGNSARRLTLGNGGDRGDFETLHRNNLKHPTYLALAELGKAIKTIFLCRYLHSEALLREIQEGLNVIENWNGANSFILYGKGGEIATNDLENQLTYGNTSIRSAISFRSGALSPNRRSVVGRNASSR